MNLEQAASELYGLPRERFTAARNALAKKLRDQDRELSDAVRRLPKASVPAAVLNTFARRRPRELAELLDLGVQLREAQDELAGDLVRELNAQAQPLVREVARQAVRDAAGGMSVSETARRQVEQMLRAAMADARAADAARKGILTRPFRSVGFGDVDLQGAVAVDVPRSRSASSRKSTKKSSAAARKRKEAERAVQETLRQLEQAEADAAAREEELDTTRADHERDRQRVQELRRELQAGERQENRSGRAVHDARQAREAALKQARSARRAAQRAQARLDKHT